MMNSNPASSPSPAKSPFRGSEGSGDIPIIRLGRRLQAIPFLLLVVGTIIAWILADQQGQIAKDATRVRFERDVEHAQGEIDKRITSYENLLRSAAGFLSAYISDRPIDRLEWRQYVATLDIERRYPGINGLGFVAYVPGSQLESFELATRAAGVPFFEVRPAGVRPDYYPIQFVEPIERNDQALGFDLYVDAASQAAANRARDIGQAVITSKLPALTNNPHQASFLMLMPVYHSPFIPQNQDERRTKLIGWVYAPFDTQKMLKNVFESATSHIALNIYDGITASPEQLLYTSLPAGELTRSTIPLFTQPASADVIGRSWLRVFETLPSFDQSIDYTQYWLFLGGGILGSIAVAMLGLVLLNTAQLARGQAERMTASLRESEERFRLITENAADLISIIDTRGRRIYSSPSYQRVLGYKPAELQRTNAFDQMHPDDRSTMQATTHEVAQTGIGHTLEYRMKRQSDGTWRMVESSATAIRTTEGKVHQLVLVARDVTERKQAEEAQRQQTLFLTALYETTLALMNRRETGDVLQSIVSRAATIASTPHGYLFQREANGEEMVMKVGTGFFAQRVGDRIKPGQSVAGLAWQRGQPQIVNNYATWTGRVPHPIFDQLKTLAGVPLKIGDEVIGIIGLGHVEGEHVFSETEISQLTQFAQLASLAFDNARLFTAAQQELAERQRTEQVLRESEARARQLIDNANDIIYRINLRGEFLYVSPVAERIVGYTAQELIGKNYLDLIRPDQRELATRFYTRQLREQQANTYYEFPVLTKDGREIWIGQNVQAVFQDNRIVAFQAVARDVTQLKQTEDALRRARDELEMRVEERTAELRESEEKYRATLENIEDGVYELDLAGRYTFFNESLVRMFGYPRAELLGLHYKQYTDPHDVDNIFKIYNTVHRTGEPMRGIEYKMIRKDGAARFLDVSASLMRNRQGEPIGFRGVVRDVTERRHSEQELRESEERFRTLFEATFEGIIIQEKGKILEVNQPFERLFGYTRAEFIGMNVIDLIAPERHELALQRIRTGAEDSYESICLKKDGSHFDVEIIAKAGSYQGRSVRVTAVRDITERKLAEEASRQSQERFSKAFLGIPVAMSINRMSNAHFLEINERYVELLGYTAQELIGHAASEFNIWVNSADRVRMYELLNRDHSVRDFPTQFRTKQGETRDSLFSGEILDIGGEPHLLAMLVDVTERKRAEAALQQQTAYLNALNETALGLIGRLDVNELLADIIQRAAELLDAPDGYLYLLEPDGQTMRMRVGTGTQAALVGARIHSGAGLTGRVWQTGEALIVNDYRTWSGRMAGTVYDLRRAVIGVPLTQTAREEGETQTQVIGVIGLSHTEEGKQFGENAVTALTRFAQLASIALYNARLFEEAKQHAVELTAINEIAQAISQQTDPAHLLETLHENLKRLMSAEVFYVGVYDRQTSLTATPYFVDAGQRFDYPPAPLPPEHWLRAQIALDHATMTNYTAEEVAQRHAAKTGDALLTGDVSKTFASSLTVPFHAGEQFDAVMSVLSYTLNAYTPRELELLSALTNHVAVALTNARLFAQTQSTLAQIQRQAQREQILSSISDRLHKATDVQSVMRIAAEELRRATGSKRAVVRVQRTPHDSLPPNPLPSNPLKKGVEGLKKGLLGNGQDNEQDK